MNDAEFFWKLVAVGSVFVNLLVGIVTVYSAFRRNPPIEKALASIEAKIADTENYFRELLGSYVLKTDCTRMMEHSEQKRKEIYETFNPRLTQGDHEFKDLQRSMGRLEGKTDDLAKRFDSLTDRIDTVIGNLTGI
jgi:chromosome segregation ATPase